MTLAQVMLPEDANPQGNVHGGALMKLADTAGAVAASRHAHRLVVTVVMDSMTFERPVYVGDLVTLHARVTWTGTTSLETEVEIDAETMSTGVIRHISRAYIVYVALDEHREPVAVPLLTPRTDEEQLLWQRAEDRRAFRLRQRQHSV